MKELSNLLTKIVMVMVNYLDHVKAVGDIGAPSWCCTIDFSIVITFLTLFFFLVFFFFFEVKDTCHFNVEDSCAFF